jgi:hypothetical protein
MNSDALTFVRILLSLVGIGLAFGYHLFYRGDGTTRKRVFIGILIVCAAGSAYTYLRLGPQFNNVRPAQIMNAHDFFHYYIGAKYHRELGFFDLYECSVVADAETHKKIQPNWSIRNLRTYAHQRASSMTVNPGHCMQLFSQDRWISFKRDVAFLSGFMPPAYWNNVLKDKGYNATPIWTTYASVLTNLLPLSNTVTFYGILSLDYLFIIFTVVVVARTFGWRNSLFVIVFWGLNFMTVFGFVKGSVSRLDWLACLVIAMCLIHRGRYTGAGALAAVATGFRMFPLLLFAGLGCKAVWCLIRTRRIPRRYLRFLVGFVVVLALLGGLASLSQDRSEWKHFAQKIKSHDEQIAGYRVGLKYAVIDPALPSKLAQWESKQSLRWSLIALVLVVVFFASQRLADHHTMSLSWVCVVFMTAPTFYYYELLVIPFMLFLPDPRRPGLSVGMGGFFGWSVLCYGLGLMYPLGGGLSYLLSWTLIALSVFTVALVFSCFRRRDLPEPGQVAP